MSRLVLAPLLLALCSAAFTFPPPPNVNVVGVPAVLAWARERTTNAETAFTGAHWPVAFLTALLTSCLASGRRAASPQSWPAQVVYSIMPDRFANGDLRNDDANISEEQLKWRNTSSPFGLESYRHGGDFAGIEARLDYLVDLGVTTLWLTPVLLNCHGEYHGYCPSDLVTMDPNFGSWDEYAQLVAAAHKRSMFVVQDIVINHQCGCNTLYSRPAPDHGRCTATLDAQFWAGTPVGVNATQGQLAFADTFFGPLQSEYFYNRCGANSASDTAGTGPSAVYGDFVSTMLDYSTPNYDFQAIFTELFKPFVGFADVDGFRLDAAKHVTEDFLAHFSTNMRAYGRALGKSDFFVVGEVAAPADWIGRRLGVMESDPHNPDNHGNVPRSLTTKLKQVRSCGVRASLLALIAFSAYASLSCQRGGAISGSQCGL